MKKKNNFIIVQCCADFNFAKFSTHIERKQPKNFQLGYFMNEYFSNFSGLVPKPTFTYLELSYVFSFLNRKRWLSDFIIELNWKFSFCF